ncbi:MAG: CAP domain-containing protein [Chloroflexota bacterium]
MAQSGLLWRWLALGLAGLGSSILLTVGVARLGVQDVASAERAADAAPRSRGTTIVREIGGVLRAPTPVAAGAPSAGASQLRPLRRSGGVAVGPDGVRRASLAGAVPYVDDIATNRVAVLPPAGGLPADDGAESREAFFRIADAAGLGASFQLALDGSDSARQARAAATPTSNGRSSGQPLSIAQPTATPVPAQPAVQQPVVVVTATPPPPARPPDPTPVYITVVVTPTSAPQYVDTSAVRPAVQQAPPPGASGGALASSAIVPMATPTPIPLPTVAVPPTSAAPTATPASFSTATTVPTVASAPQAPEPDAAGARAAVPQRAQQEPSRPAQPAGPAPILSERGTQTPLATATPRTVPAATPTVAPEHQQEAAPAPTPAPRLDEQLTLRALNAVNAARSQAGALPLSRHGALETAAWMHAQYDVANAQRDGNFESAGAPLYVAETPGGRVSRAGVGRLPSMDRVGEVMALGDGDPEHVVNGWLDSVYHRAILLDLLAQYAGYGQHSANGTTSATMDLGGKRDLAATSGWYPASGATGVPIECVCDDHVDANGRPGPFGYPVTLLLGTTRPSGPPTLARLTEGPEDGPVVPADVVDAFGNPTLVPKTALRPNTRYTARFQWNGGPDIRWSFTTAQ